MQASTITVLDPVGLSALLVKRLDRKRILDIASMYALRPSGWRWPMHKTLGALTLCILLGIGPASARPQAAREATIEPETKAQIVLQTHLNSKLNEPGDNITAVLNEPIYVNGFLVMERGTEFHGRVTAVTPAKRGQKQAQMTIVFDRVAMPWGEEPVSVMLTAIDDWNRDEKHKADPEGQVKGGHRGDGTVDNVERGGRVG